MRKLLISGLATAAMAWTAPLAAQDPPRAKVSQLFAEMMSEFPGKQVRSFVVEFPPSGESVPHTHPGPILAYVLKGTWVMQMEGMPEMTLKEGQVAYEHANHKHLVSRNPSRTEPLHLLVFFISDPGAGVSIPLAK
jgi:quercetin dioxygenase-like cupin family protein